MTRSSLHSLVHIFARSVQCQLLMLSFVERKKRFTFTTIVYATYSVKVLYGTSATMYLIYFYLVTKY